MILKIDINLVLIYGVVINWTFLKLRNRQVKRGTKNMDDLHKIWTLGLAPKPSDFNNTYLLSIDCHHHILHLHYTITSS